jgi:cytochrome c oxidase subunit II
MLSWLPENISTFGGDVDHLLRLIYYITGVWFIGVEALILYFVIRFHKSRQAKPVYVRGDTSSQAAWVLVPVFVVLMLDLGIDRVGGRVWDRIKIDRPHADYVVHVAGKQFNWEFTYPGPDGKFGTADDQTIENELHVPAGKVVGFELTSNDVIHSFFIPTLRLKQDAMPGRRIEGWFEATKPGTYEIACAELCGFGHYTMHGVLTVHTPEDYQHWVFSHWGAPKAASK